MSGQVVRETWTESGTEHILDIITDNGGRPYALVYDGTTYYYVLNQQGDVVRLVDSNGIAVANYTYNAWGEIRGITNAMGTSITAPSHIANINPIRYRGYYYDAETGFYYLQSRYYDPVLCRFINADYYASTGTNFGGYNMYAYCQNNPVNYEDETGTVQLKIPVANSYSVPVYGTCYTIFIENKVEAGVTIFADDVNASVSIGPNFGMTTDILSGSLDPSLGLIAVGEALPLSDFVFINFNFADPNGGPGFGITFNGTAASVSMLPDFSYSASYSSTNQNGQAYTLTVSARRNPRPNHATVSPYVGYAAVGAVVIGAFLLYGPGAATAVGSWFGTLLRA